jgi:energy-coupling factor transport system permease protein
MKHPLAWILWLCAVTICAWSGRNPLVLVLLALIIELVRRAHRGMQSAPAFSPLHWMLGIGALLNALWTHAGDTILVTLPESLPLVGGPITAEALTYGAVNAAALLCLLHAFRVLQQVLPISEILSMTPRALHPITVVVVIAVTYVPHMQRRVRDVREAQAVRGHAMRGMRDWLPLLMPLLVGSLEHAMQLAESMAARGYGRSIDAKQDGLPSMLIVAGLLGLLGGWILGTTTSYTMTAWIVGAAAITMVAVALLLLRRNAPRTTLHRRRLRAADILGILGAALAALGVSGPFPTAAAAAWTPYPLLQWPNFPVLLGPLLCGLCVPALFARTEKPAK